MAVHRKRLVLSGLGLLLILLIGVAAMWPLLGKIYRRLRTIVPLPVYSKSIASDGIYPETYRCQCATTSNVVSSTPIHLLPHDDRGDLRGSRICRFIQAAGDTCVHRAACRHATNVEHVALGIPRSLRASIQNIGY